MFSYSFYTHLHDMRGFSWKPPPGCTSLPASTYEALFSRSYFQIANFNSKNDKEDWIFADDNIKQIVLKCSRYGRYVKISIMR
jgi:hypothetical protein